MHPLWLKCYLLSLSLKGSKGCVYMFLEISLKLCLLPIVAQQQEQELLELDHQNNYC